ncbi:MAG TPA: hypothetical protein PKV30_08650 [Ottowia sp.]|nr:hypothetical protein [Ottowia sp.]
MGFFGKLLSGLSDRGETAAADTESTAWDFDAWNQIGREKAQRVCSALEAIIDRGEEGDGEDFTDDERSEEFADAVLDEVVALNEAGQWQHARSRFDPAHMPFVSHMGDVGLHAVAILGPERFLVRLDDEVLHIDGGEVTPVAGASMFALSRNRRWLVLATTDGLIVSPGFGAEPRQTVAWPEGLAVEPDTVRTLDVADDGRTLALASDQFGIWLVKDGAWTALAPRPGVGDDEADESDHAASADAVRNLGTEACPVFFGSYAELKARLGGPLGLDAAHAAVSPDGQWVAYGWQDAPGHYVDRVTATAIEPQGQIAARSDYPYQLRFTDDSGQLLSNSRYRNAGVTVCQDLAALASGDAPQTDDYLRAYGLAELPGGRYGLAEPVAWIGGAGWSHAAPLGGGQPVFTHFLGSALRGYDFDPASGRVAVASASGVLHVLDPFAEAEPGCERGYRPRRELFRWIFWETLDEPIRW